MRCMLFAFACAGCLLALTPDCAANDGGATYQRSRHSSGAHHGGGYRHPGGWGWGQPGWGWGGFYNPPIVVGSYYQRPHPTHLDFFRLRQRTPLVVPQAYCPTCETPTIVEPVQ